MRGHSLWEGVDLCSGLGVGILGIRFRLRAEGVEFGLRSLPDGGTEVSVLL